MFIVHGAASIKGPQFFKHHLLPNHLNNFLGRNVLWEVHFRNCSQNLIPTKTACNGNQVEFSKKLFKNIFLWNHWSDFEIISQKCSLNFLGWPFSKIVRNDYGGEGLLALYGHEEILRNSSSLRPLIRSWNNFTEMFLGWHFSKKYLCEFFIYQETWLWFSWLGVRLIDFHVDRKVGGGGGGGGGNKGAKLYKDDI